MNRPARPGSRRGFAVIVALVCLVVAAMLMAATARLWRLHRDEGETNLMRAQAAWLAESGLERAAARLARDPAYTGETWTIPADEQGAPRGGRVEIEVTKPEDNQDGRLVRVAADYPDDPVHRVRAERAIRVSTAK